MAITKAVTDESFAKTCCTATCRARGLLGRVVRSVPQGRPDPRGDLRRARRQDRVVKLNVDENPQTAQDYRVISIPTMNVYKGGEVVKTIVGAWPKPRLLSELADYIA